MHGLILHFHLSSRDVAMQWRRALIESKKQGRMTLSDNLTNHLTSRDADKRSSENQSQKGNRKLLAPLVEDVQTRVVAHS